MNREVICFDAVAPARERGLKLLLAALQRLLIGRSREGAWIEISYPHIAGDNPRAAPARERGLKCQFQIMVNQPSSRSREGAWIEI